jgi:hypothetical protein
MESPMQWKHDKSSSRCTSPLLAQHSTADGSGSDFPALAGKDVEKEEEEEEEEEREEDCVPEILRVCRRPSPSLCP